MSTSKKHLGNDQKFLGSKKTNSIIRSMVTIDQMIKKFQVNPNFSNRLKKIGHQLWLPKVGDLVHFQSPYIMGTI